MADDEDNKSLAFPGTPIAVPVGPLAGCADNEEDEDEDEREDERGPSNTVIAAPEPRAAAIDRERPRPTRGALRRVSHQALAEAMVDEAGDLERRLDRGTYAPLLGFIGSASSTVIGLTIDTSWLLRVGLFAMAATFFAFALTYATAGIRRRRLTDRMARELAGGDDELTWVAYQAMLRSREAYNRFLPDARKRQVASVAAALKAHTRQRARAGAGQLSSAERRERKRTRKRKKEKRQKAVARKRQQARRR
jgi:hypothetical protein